MKENTSHTANVVSSIAHDLRSPLNAVIGFSQLMLKGIDGPLNDIQSADLDAICTNGKAMLEMVDNLIDMAKAETGWVKPAPMAVHVQSLFEKILSMTMASNQDKQIELVCELDDDIPSIEADAAQMQKALEKIVHAAMHFVDSGVITVGAEANKEYVTVRLTGSATNELAPDTSEGLHAFLSAGTSKEHRLTPPGLQMMIGQQLITMNGGRFWVENSSKRQIAFAFCVPISLAEKSQDSSQKSSLSL